MSLVLFVITITFSDPPSVNKETPEKFIGVHRFENIFLAVTTKTEAVLDGKQTQYLDIPDETTELVEFTADLRTNKIKRIIYSTIKEF
jgi:hypothetical protein